MATRYLFGTSFPQPTRKIKPSQTDILHTLKMGERLDNLAQRFYKDPTLSWIILCANPEFDNEFEVPQGALVRVPFPLQRVWDSWLITND